MILILNFCLTGCGTIYDTDEITAVEPYDFNTQITEDDTDNQEINTITNISWTDFVRWDDISYTRDLQSEILSESYIGELIGTVIKFAPLTVTGSINNIEENGMAGNLPLDTKFYKIIGYDSNNYIAVLMEDKYYVYKTLDSESIIIKDMDEELVDFYVQIVKDLYDIDKGLNADIVCTAFDLENVTNLSQEEKVKLIDVLENYFNIETFLSTFDLLVENGYIDDKILCFKDGLLITIEVVSKEADSFLFNITKWRSGDGAYGCYDCLAEKIDGVWSYTVGGAWIS